LTSSDTDRTPPPSRIGWSRIVGFLVLAGTAIAALNSGTTFPKWLIGLGSQCGLSGDDTARWVAAIFGALSLTTALSSRLGRVALFSGGALLSFGGLATLSGALSTANGPDRTQVLFGSTLTGVSALALGLVVLFVLVSRLGPRRSTTRGLSPGWHVTAALAIFTALLMWMPSLPVRATMPLMTIRDFDTPNASAEFIAFELDRWEGQPLDATGLYAYVPELAAHIGRGTVYVVFYNVRCSHCHELFQTHFSSSSEASTTVAVIAIEIPTPPGGTVVESDEPADIECPDCVRLALPTGYAWGVTPPAVLRIEDGIVRCASEANAFTKKDCLGGTAQHTH
jgi:hypothetical protein